MDDADGHQHLFITFVRRQSSYDGPTVSLSLQAEMERALLQGERQAELDQMETEADIIAQLQHKLDELESAIQREKDKVHEAVIRRAGLQGFVSGQRLNTDTLTACAFFPHWVIAVAVSEHPRLLIDVVEDPCCEGLTKVQCLLLHVCGWSLCSASLS